MIKTTGLISFTTKINSKKYRSIRTGKVPNREIIVTPTDRALDWLSARNSFMSLLEPIFKPMVIIPAPWSKNVPGGYWFQQAGQISLVRGREHRNMSKIFDEIDMPEVYDALNAVQSTAWRINGFILGVVEQIQSDSRERGGVKVMELEPLPMKPPNMEDREARREWKYAAKQVHDRNAAHKSKVIEQSRCVLTAQGMRDYREIFFVHSLDFRGRLYPAVPYLNPQGDDLARGLLTFAHGKPLGTAGIRFLAVHGANCMAEWGGVKLDKATIDERVNWVFNHSTEIAACAHDPFGNRMWEEAEKPLQFLAFAVEWAGYLDAGDDFVSHLPVAQDGTCNGLQHYAAMTRDGSMAQHVNLVDGARPADIYQVVADSVEERLHEACHGGDDRACEWLMSGLVDRKLIKRPVMTYPYGTNVYGITDTLRDELPSTPSAPNLKKMYRYLAQTIWDAMVSTVKGAHEVMLFLQETARAQLNHENAPLVWVTPLGFPVIQVYSNYPHRQINTELAGCAIYPSVYFDTPGVMKHRHVNGVAPNFVHSLDATALMMTVNAAVKAGITEFGMVHDSYATLAADAGILADHIRVQFHRLYTEFSPLQMFWQDMHSQWSGTPEGKYRDYHPFNMDLVLKSRYFFH
jgi:DNA-directed RNA polymerase